LSELVDTDVLIWYFRGHHAAARRIDAMGQLTLSAITYFEVLQGVRDRREFLAIKAMLTRRQSIVLPITVDITVSATQLMETRVLSHGMQLGDALIAATALTQHYTLITGNSKHFADIDGLKMDIFRPSSGH
jgi:predicted nucleic acid-binding protein